MWTHVRVERCLDAVLDRYLGALPSLRLDKCCGSGAHACDGGAVGIMLCMRRHVLASACGRAGTAWGNCAGYDFLRTRFR